MDHDERNDSGTPFGASDILLFFATLATFASIVWYVGGSIQWSFISPPLIAAEDSHLKMSDFWVMQQTQAAFAFLISGVTWTIALVLVFGKHANTVKRRLLDQIKTVRQLSEAGATTTTRGRRRTRRVAERKRAAA